MQKTQNTLFFHWHIQVIYLYHLHIAVTFGNTTWSPDTARQEAGQQSKRKFFRWGGGSVDDRLSYGAYR